MSSDIGPGDLVVCVDATPKDEWVVYLGSASQACPLREGRYYNVVGVAPAPNGEIGLHLLEVESLRLDRGYDIRRFRKLNDGEDDAELIARIRKCRPIRIGEPA